MIISAQANLRTTPVGKSAEEVLRLAAQAAEALDPLHPSLKNWFALPSSRKGKYVSLNETGTLIEQMGQDVDEARRRFGDFEGLGASLTLANVSNDRDWTKPGLIVFGLNPTTGFNKFRLDGIEPFGMDTPDLMLNAMVELVKVVRPTFA